MYDLFMHWNIIFYHILSIDIVNSSFFFEGIGQMGQIILILMCMLIEFIDNSSMMV